MSESEIDSKPPAQMQAFAFGAQLADFSQYGLVSGWVVFEDFVDLGHVGGAVHGPECGAEQEAADKQAEAAHRYSPRAGFQDRKPVVVIGSPGVRSLVWRW